MSKIALVLGSGPRVGQAVANKFHSAGYRVATVSRSARTCDSDDLVHLTADFTDTTSVEPIFDQVEKVWGKSPDVVVYNAYAFASTHAGPLSADIDELAKSLNGNTISPYLAAQIAHARNKSVTYIYTGNALNTLVDPNLTALGAGKSASAHWIQAAAKAEQLRPAKFYYCDQRTPEGDPCYTGLKGEAHADLYLKLAEEEEQGEPIVVFRA
ncbi:uncharacterized protein I206_103003 [Kwoniella pini CBS 10737]|uniref:Short-chain dehydrogenase n=1 Tax=Kwoniella pini CBS 10737 TaxID=1296096 RepID=A0A1B9IAQ8_9TREE|nr:uncharacterized protein I206_01991 [Kwoniella pini CBS 10737]OCF52698.1 hypothetical protein I206_01991 [Kwoniella pini CBS 10737]